MKRFQFITLLFVCIAFSSCTNSVKNLFWGDGEEQFEVLQIFDDERFPNVVVATDGTVVATWGRENFRVRRSEDGGKTWGPETTIANPGFQGGGTIVDENTGDMLVFVEEGHPVAPLHVFQSKDHGKTWQEEETTILPNSLGHIPSMHMNEHGITLKKGEYAGRLIRPTRFYGGGNGREFWDEHYTNAMFSDDGGKTWQASEPFPAMGTGEAAIAELSDGTLYYNSRRHKSTDGLNPRWRYIAKSHDGGQTWEDLSVSEVLPDGAQHTDYGLMAGLVRLPIEGQDILLFSNIDVPASRKDEDVPFELRTSRRFNGTVWASFDGGKTWPVKRVVDEGSFAYSSLTAGRKGTSSEGWIYLFYESDGGAKMARFNLAWLTEGRHWKEFLPEN
ncbi:BNR repeat-like domain-containing protein [Tangfeifania diversioriginum]|uniref:exo-alpha-sialidase n=1 Tax=Tangfeifania diversioriginum TaxID=1168035 RepID=A0A1M6PAC2_9BACT|nr:sialidase family protein [Tangfeifania diversioriginum]SHK04810.1 BNR repeat-like domain-containing protein [Tangfeifania diversioriginum]